MKWTSRLLCGVLLIGGGALGAEDHPPGPRPDPIGQNALPPELLIQHADEIGLSDGQKDSIRKEVDEGQGRSAELQRELTGEADALGELLRQEQPDENKALAQLDKVLDLERLIKRARVTMVVRATNQLTAKQRDQVRKSAAQWVAEADHRSKSLQAKMQKVQEGVSRWQEGGKDPSPIGQIMQGLEPLLKQQKLPEAEALLDRAIKVLDGEPGTDRGGPERKQPGRAPADPKRDKKPPRAALPASTAPDLAALRAEIRALKPSKIAWRGIPWKSCLLEGLKESRRTGKPLLLWVFIDRPADDGRC